MSANLRIPVELVGDKQFSVFLFRTTFLFLLKYCFQFAMTIICCSHFLFNALQLGSRLLSLSFWQVKLVPTVRQRYNASLT